MVLNDGLQLQPRCEYCTESRKTRPYRLEEIVEGHFASRSKEDSNGNASSFVGGKNIAKSYGKAKAKEVMRDVSFTLNEGEVLGIIGESGCGKGTAESDPHV